MSKGDDSPVGQFGSEANSVLRLMGQMMRLPFTALVYSFEIFVRTLQGMQRMTDQGFETLAGDIAQSSKGRHSCDNKSIITGNGADLNQQTTHEEENVMWDDQDLSGNDLKYVSYSILFTKRDLEATLDEETQDLVSYATNGGSYGGLKIAKFMKKVLEGKIPRPAIWRDNDYPDDAVDEMHWKIPEEDEKYITFIYHVDRRIDRQAADYDKQKVEELRKIRDSINEVGSKIGP
jgi:hypothetical protein